MASRRHPVSCFQRTNEAPGPSRPPGAILFSCFQRTNEAPLPLTASRRNACSRRTKQAPCPRGLQTQSCFQRATEAPCPSWPPGAILFPASKGEMRPHAPHGLQAQSCFLFQRTKEDQRLPRTLTASRCNPCICGSRGGQAPGERGWGPCTATLLNGKMQSASWTLASAFALGQTQAQIQTHDPEPIILNSGPPKSCSQC